MVMSILLVGAALVAAITSSSAEQGYSYPSPSNRYAVPGGGSFGTDGGIENAGFGIGGLGLNYATSISGNGFSGSDFSGVSSFSGVSGSRESFLGGTRSGGSFTSGSISDSGFTAGSVSGGYSNQGSLIQKHIYVHVAPPEPEFQRSQVVGQTTAPQKHYKIVFIKAPSPSTQSAPIIPAQAQNQEKTLIYVLVKRPEDASQISIPTVAPTQPSKPEVYFIKYKTQKQTTATGGATGSSAGLTTGSSAGFISGETGEGSYEAPRPVYGPPGHSG